MKKPLWIAVLFAAFAGTAFAAAPASLGVSSGDLTAAGVEGVVEVAAEQQRFPATVRYFRITETLSGADAKQDCADCGNLVAVYAAEAPVAPGWAAQLNGQPLRIGGRVQMRVYIPSKERIVTVTAPSEATARKISASLVQKFSK